jgi:hypothetical protein
MVVGANTHNPPLDEDVSGQSVEYNLLRQLVLVPFSAVTHAQMDECETPELVAACMPHCSSIAAPNRA